jgi:type IX secretion system PorP/SprF family membrane protein
MIKRTVLTCASFLSVLSSAFSQDIHNSELNTIPLSINPAFTGMFNGDARASILYRSGWASVTVPYVIYGASFDMPIYSDKKGNYLAGGLQGVKALATDGNLSNFSAIASIAYHKIFRKAKSKKNNYGDVLSIGLQAGYNQADINLNTMYFNSPGYNTYLYRLGFGNVVNYYSINTGISYTHSVGTRFNYTIGLSGYNLNQPGEPVRKQEYKNLGIDTRYIVAIGADWRVSNRFTLRPAILFQSESNATYRILGSELKYGLKHNTTSVFIGGWYRTGDMLMVTSGVDFNGWRVGIGYDYNYSKLNTESNGQGGFNMSVRYIVHNQKPRKNGLPIPSDRF